MKSPWKYLTQLASRGKAVDQESPIERNAETEVIESEEQPTPDPEAISIDAFDRHDQVEERPADVVASSSTGDVEEATDPGVVPSVNIEIGASEPNIQSHAEEPPRAPAPVETEQRTSRRKPDGKKKDRSDVVTLDPSASKQPPTVQSKSAPETFADRAVGLDNEIKQLRCQLAEKLHLQNAQLRKMLERFGAS